MTASRRACQVRRHLSDEDDHVHAGAHRALEASRNLRLADSVAIIYGHLDDAQSALEAEDHHLGKEVRAADGEIVDDARERLRGA